MSSKQNKGLYGKLTMVAVLAASLSLSALSGAQAQSMGSSSSAASTDSASTASSNSGVSSSDSSSGGSVTISAPLPGVNNASAPGTSTAADDSSKAAAPTSEIPPGVLWTDPKYAVKEVPAPAKVAVPASSGAKDKKDAKTTKNSKDAKAAEAAKANEYDEKEAQTFAESVSNPQYVWTRQDNETKGKAAAAINASKEMHDYNRKLVENFVSHMTVPNSATMVESNDKYLYLISFTIDSKGKISHIHSESSYGKFTALNLADDKGNAAMTASITDALAKCSPLKVPPTGISPWYMLLRYEPNTGKVFVANLNTI